MRGQQDPISATTQKAVAGAVTLLVGIYIFGRIVVVMPTPESSQMANATNMTIQTTSQAFTLGAVAIVVLFAVLILNLIVGGSLMSSGSNRPPRGGNGGNGGSPPMH